MLAGALDRRVTLLHAVTTRNALNEPVKAWLPLVTVWAHKADVSDGERIRAEQVGASLTTRFQIRWSTDVSGLSATNQLDCEGRRYEISAVKEIGRREGLEITAAAQADAAP